MSQGFFFADGTGGWPWGGDFSQGRRGLQLGEESLSPCSKFSNKVDFSPITPSCAKGHRYE